MKLHHSILVTVFPNDYEVQRQLGSTFQSDLDLRQAYNSYRQSSTQEIIEHCAILL